MLRHRFILLLPVLVVFIVSTTPSKSLEPVYQIPSDAKVTSPSQSNPVNPVATWLRSTSTKPLSASYSKTTGTISLHLQSQPAFSGEIALISASGKSIYQNHHEIDSGGHEHLSLGIGPIPDGPYLLVLHDFGKRDLHTLKIIL